VVSKTSDWRTEMTAHWSMLLIWSGNFQNMICQNYNCRWNMVLPIRCRKQTARQAWENTTISKTLKSSNNKDCSYYFLPHHWYCYVVFIPQSQSTRVVAWKYCPGYLRLCIEKGTTFSPTTGLFIMQTPQFTKCFCQVAYGRKIYCYTWTPPYQWHIWKVRWMNGAATLDSTFYYMVSKFSHVLRHRYVYALSHNSSVFTEIVLKCKVWAKISRLE
jgi:hypothetical protein